MIKKTAGLIIFFLGSFMFIGLSKAHHPFTEIPNAISEEKRKEIIHFCNKAGDSPEETKACVVQLSDIIKSFNKHKHCFKTHAESVNFDKCLKQRWQGTINLP